MELGNDGFHVYRRLTSGGWMKLGEVRYQTDAEAILEHWNAGYISHRGDIIKQKGF